MNLITLLVYFCHIKSSNKGKRIYWCPEEFNIVNIQAFQECISSNKNANDELFRYSCLQDKMSKIDEAIIILETNIDGDKFAIKYEQHEKEEKDNFKKLQTTEIKKELAIETRKPEELVEMLKEKLREKDENLQRIHATGEKIKKIYEKFIDDKYPGSKKYKD